MYHHRRCWKWLPPASIHSCARLIMLKYTRCNVVILMAATAWLMLSCSSCIVCGFDLYTVLFKCPQRKCLPLPHGEGGAVKITVTSVYLTMITRAQLCIDAAGNHFQHLLWWYILWAFGCCINFCIYTMLRTRATFSWPILYFSKFQTFWRKAPEDGVNGAETCSTNMLLYVWNVH